MRARDTRDCGRATAEEKMFGPMEAPARPADEEGRERDPARPRVHARWIKPRSHCPMVSVTVSRER